MRLGLDRQKAFELICEFTIKPGLIKHALAVEAIMRGYALRFGEDEELFSIVGLLHDFDYEKWPEASDHPFRGAEILRERGYSEEVVRAVLSHADTTGVPRVSKLEHTLFASDEMAGFLVACALVTPSKKITEVTPGFVMKRLKEKGFARSINRQDIQGGAMELGLGLEEHLQNALEFLLPVAESLGL
jgi:putative nucleotidyltransferase with HDIG domain